MENIEARACLREILELKIEKTEEGLVSLKDLLQERDKQYIQRFEGLDKASALALGGVREATASALAAAKEAVIKAETANEKRFDAVNEFRSQQKDLAASLVSKDEVNIRFKAFDDKITMLLAHESEAKGRGAGIGSYSTALLAILGIVVGILAVVYRH